MSDPFATAPCSLPSGLTTPLHRAIVGLLVNSATDELTRNQLAAAYLLSLRQLVGQSVSPQPPWLFLVNAGRTAADPLFEILRRNQGDAGVGADDQSSARFRGNVALLRTIVAKRKALRDRGIGGGVRKLDAREEGNFSDTLERTFGAGAVGHYGKRHDPALGWMAGGGGDLLLWLDQPADHDGFRHDLRTRADKLTRPMGVNAALEITDTFVSVTGSLDVSRWDAGLVGDMLDAQLPAIYLPHAADGLAAGSIDRSLGCAAMIFRHQLGSGLLRVYPRVLPTADAYATGCERILRARLAHCPQSYDFFVMVTVREVDAFCVRLCAILAKLDCPVDELELLRRDLTRATIRAITLGVECMAYHGVGVAPFRPREEVCQVLAILRTRGMMSRRELQRKFAALSAEARDQVLHHLADEGLIRVEGNSLAAVPLDEFVRGLAARPGLTAPPCACAHLPDKWAGVKKKG